MTGIYIFLFALYCVLLFGIGIIIDRLNDIIKYCKRMDKND